MPNQKKKLVYIAMSADILHPGHLKIIKEGQKRGEVVIGLLTDEAIASYKRLPFMNYEQRREIIRNIRGIKKVIPQTTLDYRPNLRMLKPNLVIHGTDWRSGVQSQTRQQVISTIAKWGGKLIEPNYTKGISSTTINQELQIMGISPDTRLAQLERLLGTKKTIRAMEAHDGLSALIVESTKITTGSGKTEQFDAIWISSLTDSIAKGKPDNESIDRTSRIATINEVLDVTAKPLIVDGDTGGHSEHFAHTVRTLERLGVSAVVIEDKNGLKRNSLHEHRADHFQEDKAVFAGKIRAGLKARIHDQFMIIARIESFIIGKSQRDALGRARAYLEAGASAIMIHSKDKTGADVKEFAEAYARLENQRPLMVVPTAYSSVFEDDLSNWGAHIVVYANHLLRAAYPAMERAAKTILKNHRAQEAEKFCVPIEDFTKLIPGS